MRRLLFRLGILIATLAGTPMLALEPGAPASATPDTQLQARLDLSGQYMRLPQLVRDSLVPSQWLREGDQLVFWSAVGPDAGTWVLVHARTGAMKPLLSGAGLRAQLSQLMGKPVQLPDQLSFAIAPDQQGIVFRINERFFGLGLSDGRVTALAPDGLAALSLSRGNLLAPDGQSIAVPRDGGFAVLGSDGRTRIERSGEENYGWQIPEKAWSPDSRFLMVWRNDLRGVHKIPIVDYSSALEQVTLVPYVKTGTPLGRQELYVIEPATGRVTRIPPTEGETYDWFAGWRPGGSEALILHMSRDGKRLDLSAVEPGSGKRRRVLREERPESFVAGLDFSLEGWARQVTPLPDGTGFLWLSERDGWRHVYLYDFAGKLVRQVTRGAFPVHQVAGLAPKGDAVFLLASADSAAPYEHLLYRGSLKGGALKRMSSGSGMHRVAFSPSSNYYVDAWSSRTQPRLRDMASTDGKTRFRLTTADASALEEMGYKPPEALTVLAADGTTPLHGVLYKPRDFDPAKRYPVIAYIYAGPFITAVPWSFIGTFESLHAHSIAQMGFIVVVLDPRGTPGRSKAFQDATYGRIGQTEIPDYVAGLKQAATARPWMDMARAGIFGHSWGGYFALRGMLMAPEVFKAGYAGAPGALEEEAIINEPYLGLPSVNPAGYQAGSNMALAGNLQGQLKMMHGSSDVNASLSTTMRMADALIRAGKHFEMLIMPGQPHGPRPPADRYYFDDIQLFFVRTLGGPR
ncbi:Dipeptidyl aminopeptidase/acylaminoacyl peptidase [Stigmatella aurantiaca]|uniref:Dipeptidyl aminopeptidase/acylaminoacyl peptidase n=1 Tax=Stigmatella aurantiaca TaxID=41 RepID=A0A1H7RIG9_STIAU|nr:DPP IV N-terminal domain-containing protein [Stigmatella aurantiaca]SEL59808.1 Dipeptidyl aminopeptidase/acylaminoacyl peptidase [Stigmatella aurantiaca]